MFAGTAGTSRSRIDGEDDDVESCCSTCSSSSSSDEAAAYALPPRRAYGGVRISYVPNDAVACARKRAPASSSSSNQAQRDTEKCVVSWWLLLPCFTSFNIVPSSWLFGEKRIPETIPEEEFLKSGRTFHYLSVTYAKYAHAWCFLREARVRDNVKTILI